MLLWAWADFGYDPEISAEAGKAREKLLDLLAVSADWGFAPILFPPFDPRDGLFTLPRAFDSRCCE